MHDLRMIGAVFIARDDQEGFTLGPLGPDGLRPSDGSVAQPPGSAECNDFRSL